MKRKLMALGLLLVPGIVGIAVYWQRTHSLAQRLVEARAALGTRNGGQLIERLAQRYPENAEIQLLQARQLRLEGRLQPALAALDRAAELGWPESQVARERLLLLAQTDFSLAEPQLVRELDKDADDADVLLALAQGYRASRYFKRAESLLNRLLEHDPDNGAALWARGKMYWEAGAAGHFHKARQDLEAALARSPDQYYYADARLALANCLLDLGQADRALQLFRQCRAGEPENVTALYGVGESASFLGRWDEARDAYETVLRLHPGDVESLVRMAYIHEQRGELQQALELLEEAEEQNPKLYKVHYQMAKILRALGQTARAEEYQKRYDQTQKLWMGIEAGKPATGKPETQSGSTRSKPSGN